MENLNARSVEEMIRELRLPNECIKLFMRFIFGPKVSGVFVIPG